MPLYEIDQGDVETVTSIVDAHFPRGDLDLVIDDASHHVDLTEASFNVLFPRLRPGGLYVIEDWAWAHVGYGAHRPGQEPLTSFVFEVLMVLPSRLGLISDITVTRELDHGPAWSGSVRHRGFRHPDHVLGALPGPRHLPAIARVAPAGLNRWPQRLALTTHRAATKVYETTRNVSTSPSVGFMPPGGPMPLPDLTVPTLRITAWPDAVIDAVGHDPRSTYVEMFWLGILGPSTTWLLRRLVSGLDRHPDGYELPLAQTASALGLGNKGGRHSPFVRSLARCCQFGAATFSGSTGLAVRRRLPR